MHLSIALVIALSSCLVVSRGLNNLDHFRLERRILPPTNSYAGPCAFNNTQLVDLPIKDLVHKWGLLWRGDFSVADEILTEDASLYQDRLIYPGEVKFKNPYTSVRVEVEGKKALLDFIRDLDLHFADYRFVNLLSFLNEDRDILVTRWELNATIGNQTDSPIKKPGEKLHNNGTDIVLFDRCSGKIRSCITAQDSMELTWQMGMNVVHRPELMPQANCSLSWEWP